MSPSMISTRGRASELSRRTNAPEATWYTPRHRATNSSKLEAFPPSRTLTSGKLQDVERQISSCNRPNNGWRTKYNLAVHIMPEIIPLSYLFRPECPPFQVQNVLG